MIEKGIYMKIRRTLVVLFVISTFIIPLSLYRALFSSDASSEFVSTLGIINNVLMGIFLLLIFAFSVFTDEFPHSYPPHASRGLGIVSMLLAAACGYASVMGLLSEEYSDFTGMSGKIFAVMGILSVLSFMFYSVTFFKGENTIQNVAFAPILPALWYGFRMLLSFLRSASMADISGELPVIAMSCSFTIFLLTLGKLFCGVNSNSIKWGFAAGCIGIMTSFLYTSNWLVTQCESAADLLSHPLVFADLFMALFAIGALFHVSVPAEYFDDEEWDDYFYETYDLPKPNLILHTPVDELEEDSLLDDDINESPYIPVNASIGRGRVTDASRPSGTRPAPAQRQQPPLPQQVPSYIANPAAYYPPYPSQGGNPYYPPAAPTYPAYPAYPVYPYQGVVPPVANGAGGYDYYRAGHPSMPAEYVSPYDAAAAQYQYERRREELQSRELEKLTGEVDHSIARLQNNVTQNRTPSNEYVATSPDERIGGRQSMQPSGRNVRLAQGYAQSGERLTDHIDRLGQENRARNQVNPPEEEDEYTYEYYYPNDRSRYDLANFHPGGNQGQNNPGGRR